MNNPKVSILCLTFNHEKYIEKTLKSFLKQKTNFTYEVIIHDDASTDNTANIIRKYQKKYPEIIKPIFQTKNQYSIKKHGLFNKFLLPHAKGDYIALCEGDDYWCNNNKLQIAVDILNKNIDCVMFTHNTYLLKSNTKKKLLINDIQLPNQKISLNNSFYTHLSARVFRNIKNIPPGDTFQYHYLLSKGLCYFYNKPMSVYRYNKKGVWSSLSKKQQKKDNIILYYLINIFLKYKYNDYYSKAMPIKFHFYNKYFKSKCSWIMYLISENIKYYEVFNYKSNFIKNTFIEKILWFILLLINYITRIFTKINKKISKQNWKTLKLEKTINPFTIILFKPCIRKFPLIY